MLLLLRASTDTSNPHEPDRRPPLEPLRPGYELPGELFSFSQTVLTDGRLTTALRDMIAAHMEEDVNIASLELYVVRAIHAETGDLNAVQSAHPEGMLRVIVVVELDEEKSAEIKAKVAAKKGYLLCDRAAVAHMTRGMFATGEAKRVLSDV